MSLKRICLSVGALYVLLLAAWSKIVSPRRIDALPEPKRTKLIEWDDRLRYPLLPLGLIAILFFGALGGTITVTIHQLWLDIVTTIKRRTAQRG